MDRLGRLIPVARWAGAAGLLVMMAAQAPAADPGSLYTGTRLLAAPAAQQAAYVAGLADSLVGLHRAQLVDGFRWFESCARDKTAVQMLAAVKAFLDTDRARLDEPVANNFIWAMAAVCKYPVK